MQIKLILKNLTSIAVLGLLLVQCSLFEDEPNRPNIPGKLVFHTYTTGEDGGSRLFTMNADGSNNRNLTKSMGFEAVDGTWTNAGDSVIFNSDEGGTTLGPSIFKSNAKGTDVTSFLMTDNSTPLPGRAPKGVGQKLYFIYNSGGWIVPVLFEHNIESKTSRDVLNLENESAPLHFDIHPRNENEIFSVVKNHETDTYYILRNNLSSEESDTLYISAQAIGNVSANHNGEYLLFQFGYNVGNSVHLLNVGEKLEVPLNLGISQSWIGNWNQSGTHLILFGKRSASSKLHLYYYAFNQGSATLLDSLSNQYVIDGEGFDWYAE